MYVFVCLSAGVCEFRSSAVPLQKPQQPVNLINMQLTFNDVRVFSIFTSRNLFHSISSSFSVNNFSNVTRPSSRKVSHKALELTSPPVSTSFFLTSLSSVLTSASGLTAIFELLHHVLNVRLCVRKYLKMKCS